MNIYPCTLLNVCKYERPGFKDLESSQDLGFKICSSEAYDSLWAIQEILSRLQHLNQILGRGCLIPRKTIYVLQSILQVCLQHICKPLIKIHS